MKNKTNWVILLLFLIPLASNAQSKAKELKSNITLSNGSAQIELDSIKTNKIFNDSINNQVSLINSHLNSIQIKWDWILNNPEELIIAKESKWFDDMTAVKKSLTAKKQLLTDSLK